MDDSSIATAYTTRTVQQTRGKAQQKQIILHYFEGARNGRTFWNVWTGGEAKVWPLLGLQPIKIYKTYCLCTYITSQNKVKKIKIVRAYPGFLNY